MSTLYIRLPSKAVTDGTPQGVAVHCQFAMAADSGRVEREGHATLSDLASVVAVSQRVVLLLAAGDVTLLRVKAPPLPAAKLKAALPNLVEDQLMSDPADCVIVGGNLVDGLRTVGVVNRGWLEAIVKTLLGYGARHIAALPAQLCLPCPADGVAAAVNGQNGDIDITLRMSEQAGLGLSILPNGPQQAVQDVLQTLHGIVPAASIALYVPASDLPAYQQILDVDPALAGRMTLAPDAWPLWIAGARNPSLNLMTGLTLAASSAASWRPWRWAAALAVAAIAVNAIGLNIDWLRMKREATALNVGMVQSYRAAYPKETAIIDPIAQIRQKIAAAQRGTGQAAADDFTALLAVFGETWSNVTQGRKAASIAGLEYRERSLLVRLKADGEAPMEQMKTALAARNLTLSPQTGGTWQIRSAK